MFKFFLPKEIREQCLTSLRLDIYGEREIVWNRESLKKLLNQRLSVCWKNDERRSEYSLVEICDEAEVKLKCIDEMLISFAEKKQSPRSLIYLGNELLAEHFRFGFRKKGDKITMESWNRARQRAEEVLA